MNAPKKNAPYTSRIRNLNAKTLKNMQRNARNLYNMFNNNNNNAVEIPLNQFVPVVGEPSKANLRAGLATPPRPTRSIFGSYGELPNQAPNAPMKAPRPTRRNRRLSRRKRN